MRRKKDDHKHAAFTIHGVYDKQFLFAYNMNFKLIELKSASCGHCQDLRATL